jgi:hypothetical protein
MYERGALALEENGRGWSSGHAARTKEANKEGIMAMKKVSLAVLSAALFTVVALATTNTEARADHGGPGQHPVRRYWADVTVKQGTGLHWGCSRDDNPLGYYTDYMRYWGWRYVDANNVSYVTWFRDGQAGPYTILGMRALRECGIPR